MKKPIEIKRNEDGSFLVMVANQIVGSSVPPDELLHFIEEVEDEQIQR